MTLALRRALRYQAACGTQWAREALEEIDRLRQARHAQSNAPRRRRKRARPSAMRVRGTGQDVALKVFG